MKKDYSIAKYPKLEKHILKINNTCNKVKNLYLKYVSLKIVKRFSFKDYLLD